MRFISKNISDGTAEKLAVVSTGVPYYSEALNRSDVCIVEVTNMDGKFVSLCDLDGETIELSNDEWELVDDVNIPNDVEHVVLEWTCGSNIVKRISEQEANPPEEDEQ